MTTKTDKSGAVLVIGGGIAGMQTSLDLAEMGYFVHLVEKNPAIGGRMAQLDKVFPTNDCAMCIISPKLNDVGGHINIETMNCAEVVDISGQPGNFTARIRKNPRYIDSAKCTACGDCAKVCPVDLPFEFNMNQNTRTVTYKSYAQAFPNAYALTKEGVSPCVITCPAHVNAHGYVSLAAKGRFQEALEVILDVLPLPGTLGRVCAHPCESECRRRQMEAPLAIKDIKRLVADKGDLKEAGATFTLEEAKEGQVAIIGGGPAGLSCAYHLARRGIKSVIFEAAPVAGGALRLGIPDYRLPPSVLQAEIDFVLEFSGAEIKYNTALGKDFTLENLFEEGYKAVFLAMGAHNNAKLGVAGEDLPGVVSGVKFLREVNLSEDKTPIYKGKKILVLGGGNVAMDAARSAIRLGGQVTLAYRRGKGAMPAWHWEVDEGIEEGMKLVTLRSPQKFEAKGDKVAAYLTAVVPSGDPNDRRSKLTDNPNDVLVEEFDLVISATGQVPSSESVKDIKGIEIGRGQTIKADPITLATGYPGVFSGGDIQIGPALAIDAIAAGKEAAISISRYFAGEDLAEGRKPLTFTGHENYREVPLHDPKVARATMPTRPASERCKDFEEFELGLPEDVGIKEAARCISCGACCQCYRCVKACLPGALTLATHAQEPEIIEIEVGAVVVATGFDLFDPASSETYRYSQWPNVVTSMEFERILSASGPFQGHMVRPGDHKEPEKIAWLQCVGSRDINRCDKRYCSAVCCMYAIKEAYIAKEHAGGKLDASIFYMDIRTYGKDFEKYYNRAQEAGVRFVRSRVHTLTPQINGDVALEYIDEKGQRRTEVFDMVVLSVGLTPSAGLPELAKGLNIKLNDEGFVKTHAFTPVSSSRPGVYACGAINEPKDIPITVMEASAAAEGAGREIVEARFTKTKSRSYPDERDIKGEVPRIGVFICHCGINIASVVNVPEVVDYAKNLPFVELCENNLFTCSSDTQTKIKDAIIEHNLNRVVVASCSPRTHEVMFRETLAQAGLNKYLFEMANIRDQDSWVHQKEPVKATQKAKDLVRGAVAKAALLEPMYQTKMGLTREALVVGGGVAGLNSALSIAELGFPVHLLERSDTLGGNAHKLFSREKDIRGYVKDLIAQVEANKLVTIYKNTVPKSSAGFMGNFETVCEGPKGEFTVKHGVTVLAAGGHAHEPKSYLYGQNHRVMLSLDVDELLATSDPIITRPKTTFAFIQCVESREEARPFCSKICCTHSIESALTILDRNPEAIIYILYRDVRTYGFREELYLEARSRGVRFIRYDTDSYPVVTEASPGGPLKITVIDHVLKRPLAIEADYLTLASGIDPTPMREEIVEVFKGQLTAEGFLLEAHMKLMPVDLATHGQYLCGLAHYPKPLEETIAQSKASAARAAGILAKPYIMVGGVVAVVDPEKCAVCCTCVRACPVSVPKIVRNEEDEALRGHAFMEPAICQGCGVCVSECPGKAIKLQFFTDEQLLAKIAAMVEEPQAAEA
ncbi:MAG: FAD-dependent oxidoreductase [Deltaproteobacteria bacterium]|jgi:heterodisulfide reductase subunit A-like polyferredoxin|nr:FAD-dependent oxidoreductase [Deltaproteobacteria bacterium]